MVAEGVWFESGGLTLAGTLHRPAGIGPHPALVMLQGSGPTDRDSGGYFPPLRDHFVASGLAVLSWDKPGLGGSTGDWRQRTLFDRAAEALDALAWLRGQAAIDPTRVGLWGHSQGGWVGPLVASQSPDLAFLVVNSGPGIPPPAQDLYGIEHTLRRDGSGEADIARALAFMRALHAAAERDAPYEEVVATLLNPARGTPWAEYFGPLVPRDWAYFTLNAQHPYDPVAALERITCPVLALFGELDPLVPATESVRIFERALAVAGNRDVTLRVFPGADHRIRVGNMAEFAPGYLDTISAWIRARVGLTRERSGE